MGAGGQRGRQAGLVVVVVVVVVVMGGVAAVGGNFQVFFGSQRLRGRRHRVERHKATEEGQAQKEDTAHSTLR